MAGIYDDMVEVVECQAQMEPFNLEQLNVRVTTLEQRRHGHDISSVVEADGNIQHSDKQDISERLQYPSTPKEFQSFNRLKGMKYEGNIMTSDERCA